MWVSMPKRACSHFVHFPKQFYCAVDLWLEPHWRKWPHFGWRTKRSRVVLKIISSRFRFVLFSPICEPRFIIIAIARGPFATTTFSLSFFWPLGTSLAITQRLKLGETFGFRSAAWNNIILRIKSVI